MKKIFILMVVLLLFSISFITAPKPVAVLGIQTGGIDISYPNPYYLKIDNPLYVRFWVYNTSNGIVMTNLTVNCTYNLLDYTGKNVLRMSTQEIKFGGLGTRACQNCFNLNVSAGNFSHTGVYPFQIRCQGFGIGGFLTDNYEVTRTGKELTTTMIYTVILILVVSLLIFIGLLALGLTIPADYRRDDITGYIFALNNLKYLKYTCIGLAYATLLFISYYVWMISYQFLQMEFVDKIFQIIFYGLVVLTLPLFIMFIIITILNLIRDTEIRDALKRGLRIK